MDGRKFIKGADGMRKIIYCDRKGQRIFLEVCLHHCQDPDSINEDCVGCVDWAERIDEGDIEDGSKSGAAEEVHVEISFPELEEEFTKIFLD